MNPLHPQAQALVDAMARMNLVPPDKLSVEQAREQFRRSRLPFVAPPQEVSAANDGTIPGPGGGLRIRTYRPLGSRADELLLPAVADRIASASSPWAIGASFLMSILSLPVWRSPSSSRYLGEFK
jgi:acetyl esterase/lipase